MQNELNLYSKIKLITLTVLLVCMYSCTKDYASPINELKHSELEDITTNQDKFHPGCCPDDLVEVELITSTSSCCTYSVSINNHGRCTIYVGPPDGKNNVLQGVDGSFEYTVCKDDAGNNQTREVPVFWINHFQQIVICQIVELDSDCGNPIECDFTVAEGYQTGCSLANCEPPCWSLYQNTITDFQEPCPDYVAGVIAGWAACIDDGNTEPIPCEGDAEPGCICVDGDWLCD